MLWWNCVSPLYVYRFHLFTVHPQGLVIFARNAPWTQTSYFPTAQSSANFTHFKTTGQLKWPSSAIDLWGTFRWYFKWSSSTYPYLVIPVPAESQYGDRLSWNRDSHHKNKAVTRPSCLYDENHYSGKTTSLYWYGPQMSYQHHHQRAFNPTIS